MQVFKINKDIDNMGCTKYFTLHFSNNTRGNACNIVGNPSIIVNNVAIPDLPVLCVSRSHVRLLLSFYFLLLLSLITLLFSQVNQRGLRL